MCIRDSYQHRERPRFVGADADVEYAIRAIRSGDQCHQSDEWGDKLAADDGAVAFDQYLQRGGDRQRYAAVERDAERESDSVAAGTTAIAESELDWYFIYDASDG